MSALNNPASPAHPRPTTLAWLAAVLILFAALPRALGGWDPMPGWGTSPLDPAWIPALAFTPAWIVAMDALGVLGLLLALAQARLDLGTLVMVGLFTIGAVAVLGHGMTLTDHAEAGTPWIAAVACALGASIVGRDPVVRRLLLAVTLGAAVLMLVKGAWQVWVELPATRAVYAIDPEAYMRSQGWATDSAQVRGYERRLAGSEASAWFGLSNVLATFMAATLCAGLTLTAHMVIARRVRSMANVMQFINPLAMVGVGALGVWLSQSTAGALLAGVVSAACIAAAVVGPRLMRTRAERVLDLVGPALIAGVLGAIVVRGMFGTSLDELSVLFRWFYISTATEIFAAHPLTGVGPAGFRDAYMLAKPAIAPEDVTSPHSVLLDWGATLGIAGLAWSGMLVAAAMRAGRNIFTHDDINDGIDDKEPNGVRGAAVLLLVLGCALPGLFLQRPMLTPGYALVLLMGLVGWASIAAMLARRVESMVERHLGVAAASAGLMVLLHVQFDVTGIWSIGAPMAGLLVGLGSVRHARAEVVDGAGTLSARLSRVAAIVCSAAVLSWLIAGPALSLARWEFALHRAVGPVATIRLAENDLMIAGHPSTGPAAREAALTRVRTMLADAGMTGGVDERSYGTWRARQLNASLEELEQATALRPGHLATSRAYATLAMTMGDDLARAGDGPGARAALARVMASGEALTDARPEHSGAWSWRSVSERELWQRTRETGYLNGAIRSRETAGSLDPHGLSHPLALVDLYEQSGDDAAQREAARQALAINKLLWLDPVVQLSASQVAHLQVVVGSEDGATKGTAGEAGEPTEPVVPRP